MQILHVSAFRATKFLDVGLITSIRGRDVMVAMQFSSNCLLEVWVQVPPLV